MKIRHKILFGLLPITLLSVGIATLFTRRVVKQVLVQEVTRRGLSISLNLARSREMVLSFQRGDERTLLPPLQQIMENAGALYVMVLDPEGRVLAHTNVVERGKRYADPTTMQAVNSSQPEYAQIEIDGQPLVDVSFPVWELEETTSGEEFLLLGKKGVQVKRRLGTVRLGLALKEELETAERISAQVFWIISLVSLLAMGVIFFFARALLRPVRSLAEVAERIGGGEVGETVPVLSSDEIGELATSFNRMSQELAATMVSKDFLDGILRNMEDILLVANPDGSIRLLNRSAQRLLEYEEEELIGKPVDLLFAGEEPLFAKEGLEKVGSSLDTSLVTRSGEEVPVLLSVAVFLDRGENVEGFIVTATNITERKQAEEQIRTSLQEKELLLKEIHHRVKNNLQIISSLLSLQAQQIHDEEVLEMFSNSQNRVTSMALIHEKLYRSDELTGVNFAEYIETLTANLFQSYQVSTQHLQLRVEVQDIFLEIDEAIPCGLVINELILNALKHAFPGGREGEIYINLNRREDGRYLLIVKDSGVGLPEDIDIATLDSLGLKLVDILVHQLQGSVEIIRSNGTEFRIEFTGRR